MGAPQSPEMMTRRNAAKYLTAKRDVAYIPALIEAALVEQTSLKPVLVEYLGNFRKNDRVIDFLIGHLDPERRRIRDAAAAAL